MAITRPKTPTKPAPAPAKPAAAKTPTAPAKAQQPAKPQAQAAKTATVEKPQPAATKPAASAPHKPAPEETKALVAPPVGGEQLPDYLGAYADDRRGKENIAPEDAGTPRLKLLQPTSAEVQGIDKGEGKGAVNGYTAGQLYFPPLDRLLGEERTVVILTHDKEYVRFGDRNAGEDPGLHWKMKPSEVDKYPERRAELEWGADRTPPAAQLTHNFLVVGYDPESDTLDTEIGPAVLSLAKTNMPCAQMLCQSLLTSKGPSFIRVYKLSSRQVKNNKGIFYVLDAKPAGLVRSEETAKALDGLLTMISGKPLNVDYSDADTDESAAGATMPEGATGGNNF